MSCYRRRACAVGQTREPQICGFWFWRFIMLMSHVDDQAPRPKDCPTFFWWWNKHLDHCYGPGLRARLGYLIVHCHQHLRNHRVEGTEQSTALHVIFLPWPMECLMDMIEWACPKDWHHAKTWHFFLTLLHETSWTRCMEAFSPTTINTGKGTEFEGAIVALLTPQDHWAHSHGHVYRVCQWTRDGPGIPKRKLRSGRSPLFLSNV